MVLAYDFPLLSLFFSMLWFFLFIVWLMILFHVFADVFRSRDIGGVVKALWLAFVIFLPVLGVLAYVLVRGDKMAQHSVEAAQARDAALQSYVRQAAGTSGPGDQLAQLAGLRDSGAISEAEFEAGKAKILG